MATPPHYSNCRSIKVLMFENIKSDDLRQHFSRFGDVFRISQPYFNPHQTTLSHGTYVTFKTSEAASAAYRDRNQKVEGFRIQVYRHSGPIDSTQIPVQTSLITPEPNTVKVSMINGQLNKEELRLLFCQYGDIIYLYVATDGDPPHAYINFNDPDAAKRASINFHKESCQVHNGVSLLTRLMPPKDSQATRINRPITTQIPVQTSPDPKTVKVSMINGQLNKEELRLLFCPYGEITSLHIVTGGDPPHAYVDFNDPDAAKRASIKVHKQSCSNGMSLLTRLMPPKDSQATRMTRPITSTQIPVSVQTSPEPKTVKVSMLNGQLNKEKLCLLFCPYGEITSLHVVTNGDPPHAYINFSDPEAAKRASINFHKKSCKRVSLLTRLMPPKDSQATTATRPITSTQIPVSVQTNAKCIQYPPTWVLTPNVFKSEVYRSSEEWNDIDCLFHATMPQATLISIDRIENKNIYDEYAHRMQKMQEKGKPLNEKKLFHGSLKTPPVKIYESDEGFDFRFSDGGLWGKGAYFAVKASFSNHFSYKDQNGHKQIFLASVLTGETCLMDKEDKSLTMPPLKPGSHKRYDSVSAHHSGGSDIFVVYKLDMAYPTHLITYTLV